MTTILMIVMTICGPRETCSMVRKAPVPDGFNDDDNDDEKDDDDDENDDHLGESIPHEGRYDDDDHVNDDDDQINDDDDDDHLGESIPHEGRLQRLTGHPCLLGTSIVIIISIIKIIMIIIIKTNFIIKHSDHH